MRKPQNRRSIKYGDSTDLGHLEDAPVRRCGLQAMLGVLGSSPRRRPRRQTMTFQASAIFNDRDYSAPSRRIVGRR